MSTPRKPGGKKRKAREPREPREWWMHVVTEPANPGRARCVHFGYAEAVAAAGGDTQRVVSGYFKEDVQ